ncbi:Nitrogen assimilation transcription factor nit-4 [Psilocybe cubensis]|uniref:Nitrogen assimilation transcription factor nit-4 n=2 Tax=Psilocybe cubensis TaxID=181762 RepID=A0ACB8GGB2_PSICU|nr:Nitrogen assimilation transcription factor nit-4 [Psilocybe cubensis]KAH9474654.1 Nitrogen assimilation transcription factor nit-4 [Psilocybe cubensis]
MPAMGSSQTPYFAQYPVKTEDLSSPDLSPENSSMPHFQFKFHASHAILSHSRSSADNNLSHFPLYRFGSSANLWPNPVSHLPPRLNSVSPAQDRPISPSQFHHSAASVEPHSMSYSDDYDDITELPADHHGLSYVGSSPSGANDRTVRRRSSKACDQCRKSKCKCERSGPSEPCKNCIMLGTACTFLGPSRKRGPPKGYIDAIEARLHQTEALLGIMLASADPRAQTLLRDIGKDPLAKEIITRVDNSPYGVKGRKREDIALSIGGKIRSGHSSETSLPGQAKTESATIDLTSTHPSNEWQDKVSKMLNAVASSSSSENNADNRPASTPKSHSSDEHPSPDGRRQRRRIGDDDYPYQQNPNSASGSAVSLHQPQQQQQAHPLETSSRHRGPYTPLSPVRGRFPHLNGSSRAGDAQGGDRRSSSVDENSLTEDSEDELMGAVGQLSLNEDEQVRYHGKASGLYLLGNKERVDQRNEGGIWRFPKARVWPPLPSASAILSGEDEFASQLPPLQLQEHLLDLYFTYVQPLFPIIHKKSFLESFRASTQADSPPTSDPDASNTSPFNKQHRRIPTVLLLSMFALASRYDETALPPSDPSVMWSAGDEYLDHAKIMMDRTYASSRPSTCQALLLMGYREIGIGAMAQAWTYIGMAIRMAQDLGMHRSADGWERVGLGGRLFSEWELNERKRIWFGCVIMDKYVSTYIGRPLMIFEWDFDTPLPNDEDPEEFEEWSLESARGERTPPLPARSISCFNASAMLSGILSNIVQSIYAVRPLSSRHAESAVLEGLLDKWYIELPDHLRYEPSSSKPPPLPNVLTLHMQYCIRNMVQAKQKQSETSDDPDARALTAKRYELCNAAANHITTIVSLYQEKYLIARCPVFLCYYVFTATIMHDTNLTVHPNDPQARIGFAKCMNALRAMRVVWPSAARALDLFGGTKAEMSTDPAPPIPLRHIPTERNKRVADNVLDDSTFGSSSSTRVLQHSFSNEYLREPLRPRGSIHQQTSFQHDAGTTSFDDAQSAYNVSQPPPPSAAASSSGGISLTSMNANSSYTTWHGSNMNPHSYNNPLSTAVLPQLYSTGLVDEGMHTSHTRLHSSHNSGDQQQSQSRRYPPQYFDYSSYPSQLGAGYDIPQSVQVAQQQQQQQQQQSQQPSMFLTDQYSIYNNPPYNTR